MAHPSLIPRLRTPIKCLGQDNGMHGNIIAAVRKDMIPHKDDQVATYSSLSSTNRPVALAGTNPTSGAETVNKGEPNVGG